MAVSPEFLADIQTALGGNLVDVELTQTDYDFAFDRAKRIFQQRGNNNLDRKFVSLAVTADQKVYTLPSAENIDTIIKLIKPSSTLTASDPFSVASIQQIFGTNAMSTGGSLLNYEMGLQLIDNINIYILNDTQFIWKKRSNELTLLDNPKVSETWFIECYADLTDAEYEDVSWVRNYTIAEAKIILGNAYRKFQSLTAPSGETSLAGDQMIQEGKEEQTILIENIGDYVDGDPAGGIILLG